MTNAPRADLPVEVDITVDATGTFTGEWVDSTDVHQLLVFASASGAAGAPSIRLDQSIDAVNVLSTGAAVQTPAAAFPLYARYFRISATGLLVGSELRISARTVN